MPTFDSKKLDPILAKTWIAELKRAFTVYGITEERKLDYVVY